MQKIGILGGLRGIPSSLLRILAQMPATFTDLSKGPRHSGRKSKARSILFISADRPTDKRHWHDLTQRTQVQAVEDAEHKRAKRARKLQRNAQWAALSNKAHHSQSFAVQDEIQYIIAARLNPLYVNKAA